MLYTCNLCESKRRMCGLFKYLCDFIQCTNLVTYSKNIFLLIQPFWEANTITPTGASKVQTSATCNPLWITIGGTTSPIALAKVSTDVFSPCSFAIICDAGILVSPTTSLSLGTSGQPLSLHFQNCLWESMLSFFKSYSY